MKPLVITSGEPAGIGPDLCLALAGYRVPLVVAGDRDVLCQRAQALGVECVIRDYLPDSIVEPRPHHLSVLHVPARVRVVPGTPDSRNAPYVLDMLTKAAIGCMRGEFSGMSTAPVHKGIINQGGIPFSGHTEFLAECCNQAEVVMMLVCDSMRVALVTTHLPLSQVPAQITRNRVQDVVRIARKTLLEDFGLADPLICVAGLNPHAGEGGHLGREDMDEIRPAVLALQNEGVRVEGPLSADTLFTEKPGAKPDLYVAMYHDQGLPVLKYASFGSAVNVTAGLPIVRTSVDHGTALELAGTGKANPSSMYAAVDLAHAMASGRSKVCQKSA